MRGSKREGRHPGGRRVADGVDDLGAVLELLEPIGFEMYLKGVGGIAYRVKGADFMSNAAATYTEIVFQVRGQQVWTSTLTKPVSVSTGDTINIDNAGDMAAMIYDLIDRGVFRAAEDVGRVRTQDLQRAQRK
jgi:hypothetical protein